MKESVLQERLNIIEKECATLTDKLDNVDGIRKIMNDIQKDIKGLKLFLNRAHPEFKTQFPEIIKKIKD